MLIALALLVASSVSRADVITCMFTEPFVDSTYDMETMTLTYHNAVDGQEEVKEYVSFVITGPGTFELRGEHGELWQTLSLTFKGSNGMSDQVYPYEVKDESMLTNANNGVGGCSSERLPIREGQP